MRGPTPSFPFGNVPDLYQPSFFEKLATYGNQFHGDAFCVWIGLCPCIVISDPSHIKHVLITNDKNYVRGIPTQQNLCMIHFSQDWIMK
jgi:hypothetical protein